MLLTKAQRKAVRLAERLTIDLITYRRWLAEFPEIALLLDNISANYNIAPAAFNEVTYSEVSSLREKLRKIRDKNLHYMRFDKGSWIPCTATAEGAVAFRSEYICPDCNNTGQRDSGGTHPWGEAAYVPCDCNRGR